MKVLNSYDSDKDVDEEDIVENELYKILLESELTEEEINRCQYELRTFGSPYKEVQEEKIKAGQAVFLNPYFHYYEVLCPLLEKSDFLDTPEGKLLFHEVVKAMVQVQRYGGVDKNTIKKELLRKRLSEGCYGDSVSSFFQELTIAQQNTTLDYLLLMYQGKGQVYSFIYEIQLIFPHSVIFREHKEKNKLYVFLGTKKQKSAIRWYQAVKDMFLPGDVIVYVTWDQPFALTDINEIEAWGNRLV